MIDDINTKRTELANQMAAAGAAVLDFNGTAAALAAIPDTEPQQYVAAGTPENIAAILPATICPQRRMRHGERPTEELQWEDTPAATSGDAPTDIVQDVRTLFGACGFEVREGAGFCELVGSIDAGGVLVDAVLEHCETLAGARIERAAAPAPTGAKRITCPACKGAHSGMGADGVEWDCSKCEDGMIEAPATASGDELMAALRKYGTHLHTCECVDGGEIDPSLEEYCDCGLNDILETGRARAAVSAATKPTADLDTMLAVIEKAASTVRAFGTGQMTADDAYASLLATKPAGDQSATIIEILQARIKRMEEQQNAHRPDFLLNGTRFKLNFSARGNVDVFHNYASELQGRWVALVPAEDDMHLAPTAAPADQVRNEALEEIALLIKLVGEDWEAFGMSQKAAAAEYLANYIRSRKSAATQTTKD